MNNDRSQSKDERDLGVFIPSFLDDYGLDPYEFRVYSHIARRAGSGVCFEGLKAIGRCCLMDVKTVRQKVAVLIDMGMLRCVEHIGRTHEFTLTRHSEWKHPETIPDVRLLHTPTKTGRGIKIGTTRSGTPTKTGMPPLPDLVPPPTRSGTPPLPDLVPKGDPIKGIPIRASNEGEGNRSHEKSGVDVMEPEKAIADSPLPDEPELVKQKKPKDFSDFQEIYNRDKPDMWAAMVVVNASRKRVLEGLIKSVGGREAAKQVFSGALAYARSQPWFSSKDLDFENFVSKGKIIGLHERWLSSPSTNPVNAAPTHEPEDSAFIDYVANVSLKSRPEYRDVAVTAAAAKVWIAESIGNPKRQAAIEIYRQDFQQQTEPVATEQRDRDLDDYIASEHKRILGVANVRN